MERMAKDIQKSSPSKIEEMLNNEFMFIQKWRETYEFLLNKPMPEDEKIPTREYIMNWVRKKPQFRTLDFDLLVERY